ncbi:alpha-amylase family glycosyl hydrolase [Halobacillus sp. Marseille-P3879]|uniref:alpha-amylase family glycosyl hydrolase n=1 Tax=Halobacillus sp. Marseille-P3879 TaxID=2045014 RepID=UPI00190E6F06|nr:alpha-amylase family glycosyl hydrolase [Halobacillus sp. Marseille-P3879]
MKKIFFMVAATVLFFTAFVQPVALGSESKQKSDEVSEWAKDDVIYEVNVRQYTEEGTFEAFEKHLPRLQELGVDILWFMPVYPISEENRKGTLGSYYSIQDYTAINPEFGTMEDFEQLVQRAHDMGFKVMLDFVPNHTGWDHDWISEHPEWYIQNEDDEIVQPPGTDWTDVAQLDYENEEMRKAMIEEMKFWVEKADIDGYRMDVAGRVPADFWEEAKKELDEIKPIYMLAEDSDNLNLLEESFDANYGWPFLGNAIGVANGENTAEDIRTYISEVEETYPEGTYPMNFLTNHDENSWNGTNEDLYGEANETLTALTFTMPGMPLIYSGEEAGLDKMLEFFEKDEINWNDLSMQKYYEKLIDLKKENPALWNGNYGGDVKFLENSNENVLAFEREKNGNKVVVVMNLTENEESTTLKPRSSSGKYTSYFSDSDFILRGKHTLDLEPWEFKILVQNKQGK